MAKSIAQIQAEDRARQFHTYKQLVARQHQLSDAEMRELISLATALRRDANKDAAVMNEAAILRGQAEGAVAAGKAMHEARAQLTESQARHRAAIAKANAENHKFVMAELKATADAQHARNIRQAFDQFVKDHADLLGS